ncbi:DUF1254 domain-containing protein [Nocardia sp. NPDC050710]|uniref:DUF1254 domain-containing protein n=1 Tax=Nocardia sp. NPDC050710 TaxID=3157220 RepID=UPI0033FDB6A2
MVFGRRGRPRNGSLLALAALTVSVLVTTACASDGDGSATTPSPPADADDAKSIATDAYVFGYPLVLMDATRATAAPANTFDHATSLPTPDDRQVVRLNLDTLYSQAWLDLRAEPMVLQVPAMEAGRYWLMQILDAWSNTRHDPSSIEPQTRAGAATPPYTYVITGPGWSGALPANTIQLSMPTNIAWLIGRIQVDGQDDVDKVLAIQRQMRLVPVSRWNNGPLEPTAAAPPSDKSVSPTAQVAAMDGSTFFAKMNALMAADPPAPEDAPAMKRFATIGVAPGGTVNQPADTLDAAAAEAQRRIAAFVDAKIQDENGWQFAVDVGAYGTDYLVRASVALRGLGANLPRDAVYPTIFGNADVNGTPRRFRIRFAPGQLPPVGAFWSITAYDADSFLIDNPADIYAVGHQVPVVAEPDGSVEIAVQHDDPGADVPTGNWLPIPASGPFSLTMRLYAPELSVLDGSWRPPALNEQS